jgi:L-ascorbate metabolism protein UlaG (beta-lactamase superfamily)
VLYFVRGDTRQNGVRIEAIWIPPDSFPSKKILKEVGTMKLKWYGHSAFKLTTDKGVRIIVDPYESGFGNGGLTYGKITDEADLVLTSHEHGDHSYVGDIKGSFTRVEKEGSYAIAGVKVTAIPCFHDSSKGKDRGKNLIFVIEADGLKLAHVGDLGHTLSPDILQKLGSVDVLLLPVGGFYTIDAKEATEVMNAVKPKLTVPMHYRTEKCAFPITGVDEFTKGKKGVKVMDATELDVGKESLPKDAEIVVLNHAL